MRRIAVGLGIDVSDERFDDLAEAATFESMQSDGDRLAPDPAGILGGATRSPDLATSRLTGGVRAGHVISRVRVR